jgi:hypothetical protein
MRPFFCLAASPLEDGAMRLSTRLLSIAVLSSVVVAGCASSVRISELKAQPDKYERKTVSITGTVTDSYGIPLVPFQLYKVQDETGDITIVSRASRSPSKGARVQVKGKVNEVAVVGGRSIGLHIDEDSRKVK